MQLDHVEGAVGEAFGLRQGHRCHAAAAFLRSAIARVVDQDAPHHARGQAEEIGAAGPALDLLHDEAQVGLVHQCSRLQRMAGTLARELAAGQALELVVDNGKKRVQRGGITGPRCTQLLRDIDCAGHRGSHLGRPEQVF